MEIRYNFDHDNNLVKVNIFVKDENFVETSEVDAIYNFTIEKGIFQLEFVEGNNKYFQQVANLLKTYRDVKEGFYWETDQKSAYTLP